MKKGSSEETNLNYQQRYQRVCANDKNSGTRLHRGFKLRYVRQGLIELVDTPEIKERIAKSHTRHFDLSFT